MDAVAGSYHVCSIPVARSVMTLGICSVQTSHRGVVQGSRGSGRGLGLATGYYWHGLKGWNEKYHCLSATRNQHP